VVLPRPPALVAGFPPPATNRSASPGTTPRS